MLVSNAVNIRSQVGLSASKAMQSHQSRRSVTSASKSRLIFSAKRSEHNVISPLLSEIQWLGVQQRIPFRLCVLVYHCFHGTARSYLADNLYRAADVGVCRHLRSANSVSLVVPSTRRSTISERAFPVAATRAYNELPTTIKASPSLLTFRKKTKNFSV